MRPEDKLILRRSIILYLCARKGQKNSTFIKTNLLRLITPTGRQLDFMNDKSMDIQVDVQKGEKDCGS
jgi:hypothetical protein